MGSPFWVEFCLRSRSDRRLLQHLPYGLVPSLLDGVTRLGSCCVFLRNRSERRLLPSIYSSLLCDEVTLWVERGFPLTQSKQSFLWITGRYSFRMGSPFSGQTNVLISIERISTVGLLGVFFQLFLGLVFCHPGFVRLALKSGGGGGVPHSAVFTSGADSVCIPLANEGVGLGPSPPGPVASPPPLAGRSASAVWRCFFH